MTHVDGECSAGACAAFVEDAVGPWEADQVRRLRSEASWRHFQRAAFFMLQTIEDDTERREAMEAFKPCSRIRN